MEYVQCPVCNKKYSLWGCGDKNIEGSNDIILDYDLEGLSDCCKQNIENARDDYY